MIPDISADSLPLQGVGKQKILLVGRDSDLNGAGGFELLSNIIKAIKYDIGDDCYLLSLPDGNDVYPIASLIRRESIEHLIVFGVNPKHLGFSIKAKLYEPQHFEQFIFLLSHKVTEMSGNRDFKMSLWKCLQKLFPSK